MKKEYGRRTVYLNSCIYIVVESLKGFFASLDSRCQIAGAAIGVCERLPDMRRIGGGGIMSNEELKKRRR